VLLALMAFVIFTSSAACAVFGNFFSNMLNASGSPRVKSVDNAEDS